MGIFVPKKTQSHYRKGGATEYNYSSVYANAFDAFYVFESLNPTDIIGAGGDLAYVASPGDGGTLTLSDNPYDYGVSATATDLPTTGDSTKLTADVDNTFWTDRFDYSTIYADFTCETIVGGPQVLLEIGGATHGLGICYRTTPKTLHVSHARNMFITEIGSLVSFNPSSERIRIIATTSPSSMALYMQFSDLPAKRQAFTIMDATVEDHGNAPGFLGLNNSSPVVGNTTDGWQGDMYALGISTTRAMDEEEALAFLNAPYQILKPRRSYWLMPTGNVVAGTRVFDYYYKTILTGNTL